jgi:hypothetical protein
MAHYPRSISQNNTSELFELQVARGQIPGHQSFVIFGYNDDVDQTMETVWPYGGLLAFPAAVLQMSVSSDNATDTSSGVGARTVYIQGLNASHAVVSETVTLAGLTAVTTVNSYLHINQMYVATSGTNNGAVGSIYIGTGTVTLGIPATVYDLIKYDYNNRVTGSYTVPAGYTAYISQGLFSTGQSSGTGPVTGRLVTRGIDNIRRTAAIVTLNNGAADYVFEYPVVIPEKTTIEAQAIGTGNNNACSSMFILVLIANGYENPPYGV